MKTKLIIFITILMMLISLTSCGVTTYATTQDDIYIENTEDIVNSQVNYNIVISSGTPYYYNGSILYYYYDGLYYYPFYYNNYWYMRVYRRPFNHIYYRPYFRPHRYDYRFNRGYVGHRYWYRNSYSPMRRYSYPRVQYRERTNTQRMPIQNNYRNSKYRGRR
jgi:hypothetical protein